MIDDGAVGHRLAFRSLTEANAEVAASWFDGDEEGRKEFGGFYGVHPKWWTLVSADDSRHGWLVCVDDEPVGFADVDVDGDGTAEVSIYIRPSHRGLGLGSAALRALGPVCRRVGVVRLRGAVRPDNAASLAAVASASGELAGTDEFGYLVFLGPRLDRGATTDQ